MPRMNPLAVQEQRVWDLLTRDFSWEVPAHHPVKVYDVSGNFTGVARLQIFEMAVTTVLAHLRPEFEWRVTQNRPDSGVDFIGRQPFLEDSTLRIDAAITVGGQCKKRTRVNEVLGEIAGSLLRMADAINPTIFVVVLSARLNPERVQAARQTIERQCQRHCHILDRAQIEGLLSAHLDVVAEVLREGLTAQELVEVLEYFHSGQAAAPAPVVEVIVPDRVLSGLPFRVEVRVRWALNTSASARLWWQPEVGYSDAVALLAPHGADAPGGTRLATDGAAENPLQALCVLEFVTYSVGQVELGNIFVGLDTSGPASAKLVPLGRIEVIESMRPRFFDQPYRAGLARLSNAYDRALAGNVTVVGVTGAGGSGKSRMCEEFALERRRGGCTVISAKQAKTHDAPQRLLADLLLGLAAGEFVLNETPADTVNRVVANYDPILAARASSALSAVLGVGGVSADVTADQSLLSVLVLLIVARSRLSPVIVHLQDLHWCGVDVLSLLERLVSQLSYATRTQASSGQRIAGRVLFLLEGRLRESGDTGYDTWSSAAFEAFLDRSDCERVTCSPFDPDASRGFVRVLFEDRHNAHRQLSDELLPLQRQLIDRVHQAAGGNPFHSLEQVRLLKEMGVLGQNPITGLLFLVRPEFKTVILPESVFLAIQARWHYLTDRAPRLALLLWACAILEDQIPRDLFCFLWSNLAQNVSLHDIDATDVLWTGDGAEDPVFRHENYFESLRRFAVSAKDRTLVVDTYCDWFANQGQLSPTARFSWARVILQSATPDVIRAKRLLAVALRQARKRGDIRLARRIATFYLDLIWSIDAPARLKLSDFIGYCDEEVDLCRELLGIDRRQARHRLQRLRGRIEARMGTSGPGVSASTRDELERCRLMADMIYAQLLFNDRSPGESADIATTVIEGIRAQKSATFNLTVWESVEMEGLYTLSCAQALSGDLAAAVHSSESAAMLAMRSASLLARKVVSTAGSVLLAEDPAASETLLRDCLERWPDDDSSDAFLVHVHLSMSLVLQAHRLADGAQRRAALLDEARARLSRVSDSCRRFGLHADQGAAALVRGVVSAMSGERDEASWFAQGVAAASRGQQMETLWRSHINCAIALRGYGRQVSAAAHDHAFAAAEIMQETLIAYPQPDKTPRFEVLRIGLANAVSILIAAGDNSGRRILERYPRLRSHLADPESGTLSPYDGGRRHFQWLRINDVDYVLY